ncbi:TonB C-terminal domain-containing protein [Acinetobacter sp. ANC 4641]|uniref:TonB C-terminal domain-containing protein n=1 Tax=Acinetobacter sp. ANC 4641 TaxID=2529847 RepID=UPI00103DB92F|nr:TonB C-terminal domain-containing protein [Acinetobacter sp. ANC 4641]TCB12491.1 hypothetical protein E0H78_04690 [Acinetobacter sp. ANC 4641]
MLNLKSTFQYLLIRLITLIILSSSHSVFAQQTAPVLNELKRPTISAKTKATPEAKKQAAIDSVCRHILNITNTFEADKTLPTPQLGRLYACKIRSAWELPNNTAGQTAKVKIQLDSDGDVLSTEIQSNSKEMQDSIRQAILKSAPYPYLKFEHDPKFISITFTAK